MISLNIWVSPEQFVDQPFKIYIRLFKFYNFGLMTAKLVNLDKNIPNGLLTFITVRI
jgi:hypothetical protein